MNETMEQTEEPDLEIRTGIRAGDGQMLGSGGATAPGGGGLGSGNATSGGYLGSGN
jgi:hypothetical protein